MENNFEKQKSICRLTQQSLHIPAYMYHGDNLIFAAPAADYAPPYFYLRQLFSQEEPIFYTEYGACFARIDVESDSALHLVLGPISTLQYEQRTIQEMYLDYGVAPDRQRDFCAFFSQIPLMTQLDFFYHLTMVYFMVNGREVTATFFTVSPKQEDVANFLKEQVKTMYEHKENSTFNNSLEIERAILSLVKSGDVQGMRQYIDMAPSYQAGIVADNHLRLQKNYFISTVTLATRAAIEAGLPEEQAFRLSDLYISKAEAQTSIGNITTLFMQALLDFTVQVNSFLSSLRHVMTRDTNQMVEDCMEYVQKHTHSLLTVGGIANALGYHRSYLSNAFAKTTGIHLNDYIYQCKLEESQYLLAYTAKTVSEISSSLCFSSQSHFLQRFKKLYGISPIEYRRESHKSRA